MVLILKAKRKGKDNASLNATNIYLLNKKWNSPVYED